MKTVDLFAGCGGLSLGFQNQGFEIIEAFDNWEKAIKIYEKNFNHKITNLDLSLENAKEIIKSKKAEIIIIENCMRKQFDEAEKRGTPDGCSTAVSSNPGSYCSCSGFQRYADA